MAICHKDGTCEHGSLTGTYKLFGNNLEFYVNYYDSKNRKNYIYEIDYTIEELKSDKMVVSHVFHGNIIGETVYDETRVYTMTKKKK